MTAVHRQLYDHEIALGHDAMDGRGRAVEVVVERRQRLAEPVATLESGRVLHEVLGDEVQRRGVAVSRGPVEGQHGLFRCHRVITCRPVLEASSRAEGTDYLRPRGGGTPRAV